MKNTLKDDLRSGYIQTLVELVHAHVFADFLEMAQHLSEAGYKDAAAVIAGSTLESHLRALAEKYDVQITFVDARGNSKPKRADAINAALVKADVYTKLDQKSVTAWLDLRNKAAHGTYADFTNEQVVLLISSMRDFIARNPA